VSEFDFVLGIANDGTYRIMTPVDKIFFTGKLIHCDVFDPEVGAEFVVVYRDKKKIPFGKWIKIHKFIRNKEYQLIKNRGGKVDFLLTPGDLGTLRLDFTPAKRQRIKHAEFDLAKLELTSPASRGTRLAAKSVSKVKYLPPKATKSVKTRTGTSKAKRKKTSAAKKSMPDDGPAQGDLF